LNSQGSVLLAVQAVSGKYLPISWEAKSHSAQFWEELCTIASQLSTLWTMPTSLPCLWREYWRQTSWLVD